MTILRPSQHPVKSYINLTTKPQQRHFMQLCNRLYYNFAVKYLCSHTTANVLPGTEAIRPTNCS